MNKMINTNKETNVNTRILSVDLARGWPYKLSIYFGTDLAKSLPLDRLNDYTIFTIVDILQFAGIELIIMAILQELKNSEQNH